MLNTILSISAITVLAIVCVVMHIRQKKRIAALESNIDESKQKLQQALDTVQKTKEDTDKIVNEYYALNQAGLRIIKHKKQKEIYNTTYEAIRKFFAP